MNKRSVLLVIYQNKNEWLDGDERRALCLLKLNFNKKNMFLVYLLFLKSLVFVLLRWIKNKLNSNVDRDEKKRHQNYLKNIILIIINLREKVKRISIVKNKPLIDLCVWVCVKKKIKRKKGKRKKSIDEQQTSELIILDNEKE